MKLWQAVLVTGAVFGLAACGESPFSPDDLVPAFSLQAPVRLTGAASSETFNVRLVLAVIETRNGVRGLSTIPTTTNTPNVIQLVPPSGTRDYWCVTTDLSGEIGIPDFHQNWHIRDVGDGITSFDEFEDVGGVGINCTSHPDPDESFKAFDQGDFKGSY